MLRRAVALSGAIWCLACESESGPVLVHDVVIEGARVLDPESGLDAVRNVGIREGVIAIVTPSPIEGRAIIDGAGLVLAPGFIDLNTYEHGDDLFRLRAADGVTSVLNLEGGATDVPAYYAALEGRSLINFGAAVDHETLRDLAAGDTAIRVESGVNEARGNPETDQRALREEEMDSLLASVRSGLEAGAVALGFAIVYTPGATHDEVLQLARVAAAFGVPVHMHTRDFHPTRDWGELYEPLALAALTGASIHVKHLQSTFGSFTQPALKMIEEAQAAGLRVSTECYPYTAGLTFIESAPFDDFDTWSDERFALFEWPETGERLTRASFPSFRARGGVVVIHPQNEESQAAAVLACVVHPMTMIASDGAWDDGHTHPRSAGTNSKVLGRYVRELGVLNLMEAVRKMTLAPALHLESAVPQMARKGRVQEGMDADLVLFDADLILDRSTYQSPLLPPVGIHSVLVGGIRVVEGGRILEGTYPGQPLRRTSN